MAEQRDRPHFSPPGTPGLMWRNRRYGRNILITGASSGIGLALARRYATRHRLLVTARKLSPELEQLIDGQGQIEFVAIDLRDPQAAARRMNKAIAKLGWQYLDNAVLNAGMGNAGAPQGETPASIRDTLAVNLTSNLVLSRNLHPLLAAARGTLSFIGSTAHRGAPGFATYAAAKAGLHGAARALREEWRGEVSVQIIHPGPTRTGMHAKAGHDPGPVSLLFADADAMAAMIDSAIARRRSVVTRSFFHYWTGGGLLERGLSR